MAVEGGLKLAVGDALEVGNQVVQISVGSFAVVALAVGRDGVDAPGAAGQGAALQIRALPDREVVHGVGEGGADFRIVHGTGDVGGVFVEIQRAGFGVADLNQEHLGVADLIELHIVNFVQEAVVVGGDGQVFPVVQGLGVAGGGVIDVLAQVVPAHHLGFVVDAAAQNGGIPGVVTCPGIRTVGGVGVVLIAGAAVGPQDGVKDGGGGPVAQEAQEGQADLGIGAGFVGEDDVALHIGAVGEECPQLLHAIADVDGAGDRGCAAGGNTDGVQSHFLHENVAVGHGGVAVAVRVGVRPQNRQAGAVGQGLVGQVPDLEAVVIAAGPVHIIAQLQLADGLVLHGDIGRGLHGGGHIGQTGALNPGRIADGAVGLRHGGAHQQLAGQLAFAVPGGQALLPDVLPHQDTQGGHMGGGHGGAAHHAVGAGVVVIGAAAAHIAGIQNGGPDVAAGGGDFRLQLQAGACAPGGEFGHLAGFVPAADAVQLVYGLQGHGLACFCGCRHGGTVHAGDEAAGDGGVADAHVDQLGGGGIAVIDDDSLDGTLIEVAVASHLRVVGIVVPHEGGGVANLVREADFAALHQGDTGHALLAITGIAPEAGLVVVTVSAGAAHGDDFDAALGHVLEGGLHGHVEGIGKGDFVIGLSIVPHQGALGLHGAVDGGHGQVGVVDGGGAHHADVGIAGQVGAVVGAAAAGVGGVACGGHQDDARRVHLGVDLRGGGVVLGEAVVRAQGQVDDVGLQLQGVLQGVDDGGFRCASAVGEHLHNQQLGVRGHTGEDHLAFRGLGVTGDGAGHMGAVAALRGTDVDVAPGDLAGVGIHHAGVVKGKGNLAVLVVVLHIGAGQGVGVEAAVVLQGAQVAHGIVLAVIHQIRILTAEGIVPEGLVGAADAGDVAAGLVVPVAGELQIQAGVQNGGHHALAGVAPAPGGAHAHHVIAVALGGTGGGQLLRAVVGGLHIGPLHTGQGADGIQLAVGNLDGHAVDEAGPLGHDLQAGGGCAPVKHGRLQAADLRQNVLLARQQLCGQGLGVIGGQEPGHRLTGGQLLTAQTVGLRAVIVQDGGLLQLDDHGDDFLVRVGARRFPDTAAGPGGRRAVGKGHIRHLFGSDGPNLSGLRRHGRREQTRNHDQSQQERQNSFHLLHPFCYDAFRFIIWISNHVVLCPYVIPGSIICL